MYDGIKRIEGILQLQTSIIPPFPDLGISEKEDEMDSIKRHIENMLPLINPNTSVSHSLERCSVCQRGGIKLSQCSGCRKGAEYCSKQCQISAWKTIHKYVCTSSKSRLEHGMKVQIEGLQKAQHYNGQTATIVNLNENNNRFIVKITNDKEDGGQSTKVTIKPQNLKKVD